MVAITEVFARMAIDSNSELGQQLVSYLRFIKVRTLFHLFYKLMKIWHYFSPTQIRTQIVINS